MFVSCEEMQRAEEAAFARGIGARDLMESVGFALAALVEDRFSGPGSQPGTCVAWCGRGNNAGDALVALRELRARGWQVGLALADSPEKFSELPARYFRELDFPHWSTIRDFRPRPFVILDGLLGLGARGAPRGGVAEAISEIARLREEAGARVLAIDLPSGLDADSGEPADPCVIADLTATIGAVKRGLLADAAVDHVGHLELLPLPDVDLPDPGPGKDPTSPGLATPTQMRRLLPLRAFSAHKGSCGRVGIIAGSPGFSGAARLASGAAVHGGAGLVTLLASEELLPLVAASTPAEVMLRPVGRFREILNHPFDVLALGPGCGRAHAGDLLALMRDFPGPLIIDADGLNILAEDLSLLQRIQGPRLLTPHPGEMERLLPRQGRSREQWLNVFLDENTPSRQSLTVLLKGARTLVGREGSRSFNPSGHPGMASGGMGDVLTGVIAALAAQIPGHDLFAAARLGAWLCGRSAELAVSGAVAAPEALAAGDVISHLGAAFRALREDS